MAKVSTLRFATGPESSSPKLRRPLDQFTMKTTFFHLHLRTGPDRRNLRILIARIFSHCRSSRYNIITIQVKRFTESEPISIDL